MNILDPYKLLGTPSVLRDTSDCVAHGLVQARRFGRRKRQPMTRAGEIYMICADIYVDSTETAKG